MKLSWWMLAIAAAVAAPSPARAQACGSAFTTCSSAAQTTMSQADLDALTRRAAELAAATAAVNGCPSPNGEQGAESVAEHNPHCSSSGDVSQASVAPEPGTFLLFGTALLAFGASAVRRRRRQ